MNIKNLDNILNFSIVEKFENNRQIKLFHLQNIYLTGISTYYPDILFKNTENDFFILPLKEMSMSLNKKSYYEENGMIYNGHDKDITKLNVIYEDVYFFIYNTENYYHFIYDTIPYLYSYLKIKKQNKKIKLLMNYNKNKNKHLKFVEESLALLGINDILIHKEDNLYKNIYLSNSLTHDGLSNEPPRKEIFELYEIMIKNALKTNLNNVINHDKIYISRRTWINKDNDNIGTNYTLRRKLTNEDLLVKNLEEKGFFEFFGENYSMAEKIIIFNKSKMVIGAIGGTITNCVFCGPNTKIITLVSPDFLRLNYRMSFLFKNNNYLFKDSCLDCKDGEIPPNVRIEVSDNILEKGMIGEIICKKNDGYLIRLGKNFIGLSQDENYDTIFLKEKQFLKLDNGINSPWKIDINKLLKLI